MPEGNQHYDVIFGNFMAEVLKEVRREVYGDDFGQNSWLTTDEFASFRGWLGVKASSRVLDVASGSGGPALLLARGQGCRVAGFDINPRAVATAHALAASQGLKPLVDFLIADGAGALPFADETYDCIMCIDAINHFRNRALVLREWHRVLRPDGLALYTDGTVVTGPISNDEILARSSIGYLQFSPPGENERLIALAGLRLVLREDVTGNIARLSKRRVEAREKHREGLLKVEGRAGFEGEQRFYSMVHTLASEGKLSRFAFVAGKPGPGG